MKSLESSVFPIILSGGLGTRLWPLSRQSYPKQFISLRDDYSLLQNTLQRVSQVGVDLRPPIILCNEDHRFVVAQQLQEIGVTSPTIILEPESKNTAPATTIAALVAQSQASSEDNPILLVLPADHMIEDQETFMSALAQAVRLARSDVLPMVTLGVPPNMPATEYGYIKKGRPLTADATAFEVEHFLEKPGLDKAEALLASGDYFWNSGMFVFSAQGYLDALVKYAPEVHDAASKAWKSARHDEDFIRLDREAFCQSPNISIDYAVMEPATNIAMVPLNAGWSDLGSWQALSRVQHKDKEGNFTVGDVILHKAQNTYVRADGHLVAVLGTDNLIIVDTPDALLVADKSKVKDIPFIIDRLEQLNRYEHKNNRMVHRPWGSYDCLDAGDGYLVKHITVKPRQKLSLQSHQHRAEHWIVLRGTARVTCDDKAYSVNQNESSFIPPGAKHRLENLGSIPLEIIEVQSGSHISEDDIVRYEDIYGRLHD